MALVDYGSFITHLNGSIGNVTFFWNGNGLACRRKVVPVDTWNELRIACRLAFSDLQLLYQQLTDDQRQTWITAASQIVCKNKIGQSYHQSGQMLFQSRNLNLFYANQSPLTMAPTEVPCAPIFAATCLPSDANHLNFQCTFKNNSHLIPNSHSLLIQTSNLLKLSVQNPKDRYRIIQLLNAGDDSNINLAPLFSSVWEKEIKLPGTIFIRVRLINNNTGLSSPSIVRAWQLS